jgi:outer membrane protein OmpA-like peptidoglycan-associated protein
LKTLLLPFLLLASVCLTAQGTLMQAAPGGDIEIENCARINDVETQFGPAIYGDDLIFLTRPRAGNIDLTSGKTFFKLFRAPISANGMPGNKKRFYGDLNSNYNEGPVSFTQEDRVIFFTRTLQHEGATVEDRGGKANLGIYSAFYDGYDWAGIRPLPFNGTNFSNQHPSVTANGKRVFFSSNREGGFGGFDLYFSDFHEGHWSPAINIGAEVNTEGNEAFPHIHPSGRLFFASDGHGGRGGLDLFMIDLSQRRWGELINLPLPVNSAGDDAGITLSTDGNRAYLVSNRTGGKGEDDIYLLRLKRGMASLQGPDIGGETLTLYNGANSRRVTDANVWLGEVDPTGRLPAEYYTFRLEQRSGGRQLVPVVRPIGQLPPSTLRTDQEGSLRLELVTGRTYELIVHKNGFATQRLRFVYTPNGPSRPLAITLLPENCRTVSGRITARNDGSLEAMPLQFRPQNCALASFSTITDVAGNYEICLPAGCDYLVSAGRAGYETGTGELTSDLLLATERPVFDLQLKAEGNVGQPGGESREAIMPLAGLNFFDGTAILQEELSRDIAILHQLLLSRPDLKLLLIAHTDGQQSPNELVRLGEQRAEALRQALLRRGIATNRLRTIAYGNAYRLSDCINCGPADFAANNRMEAKVIGY